MIDQHLKIDHNLQKIRKSTNNYKKVKIDKHPPEFENRQTMYQNM